MSKIFSVICVLLLNHITRALCSSLLFLTFLLFSSLPSCAPFQSLLVSLCCGYSVFCWIKHSPGKRARRWETNRNADVSRRGGGRLWREKQTIKRELKCLYSLFLLPHRTALMNRMCPKYQRRSCSVQVCVCMKCVYLPLRIFMVNKYFRWVFVKAR